MIIRVDVQSEDTRNLLAELYRRTGDIKPAMDAIGQILVSNTQLRFVDQKDPAGNPWAPLSAVTIARRRQGRGAGSAQILRDTGRLASSISYKVTAGSVGLGTNVIYAGTHQYGARKGQYGVRRGHPIPWGDVPQRSFFGYNDQDRADVEELLDRYINAARPPTWWQSFLARFRRLFG
jgi:phage virion morphogenesis protein